MITLSNFPLNYRAVVLGATGGIGRAFVKALRDDPRCGMVVELSRQTGFDLADEETIAKAASEISKIGPVHLIIDATGFLHDNVRQPEKTIRALTAENMAHAFTINAIGPLLMLKHFHPLLPLKEKGVIATLSARVGSIEDNRLGGWISYRASKAALNMGLKTTAIEVGRKYKKAALIALHPGTVQTRLSDPFAGKRATFTPDEAVGKMLTTINVVDETANGRFMDYDGLTIPW